tara:strand:+ start:470 stop:1360 length:891 start_codon:yes stop_codon:yes gene_type:complete
MSLAIKGGDVALDFTTHAGFSNISSAFNIADVSNVSVEFQPGSLTVNGNSGNLLFTNTGLLGSGAGRAFSGGSGIGMVLSVWFKPDSSQPTSSIFHTIFEIAHDAASSTFDRALRVTYLDNLNNTNSVHLQDLSNDNSVNVGTVTAGQWNHLLVAVQPDDPSDPDRNKLQTVLNNGTATDITSLAGVLSATMDGSEAYRIRLGRANQINTEFAGCVAEVFFTIDKLALTTANIRKFINADGTPVYLGNTGQTPTGSQPLLFFTGSGTAMNNVGSASTSKTTNGTVSACDATFDVSP